MLGLGSFGAGELDQFDFLELVLADDAACILAGRSGFGAEAWSVGGERDGQARVVEDFVAVEVGDGDFGGGDEVKITTVEQRRYGYVFYCFVFFDPDELKLCNPFV